MFFDSSKVERKKGFGANALHRRKKSRWKKLEGEKDLRHDSSSTQKRRGSQEKKLESALAGRNLESLKRGRGSTKAEP